MSRTVIYINYMSLDNSSLQAKVVDIQICCMSIFMLFYIRLIKGKQVLNISFPILRSHHILPSLPPTQTLCPKEKMIKYNQNFKEKVVLSASSKDDDILSKLEN